MKNKSLIKDIFRTIKNSLTRYLAIIAMTCLGATVFIGLKTTGPNLRASLKEKTQNHNMYDFKVESYLGLEEKDKALLENQSYIDQIEYGSNKDFFLKDEDKKLQVYSLTQDINKYLVKEGRLPQAPDEIALDLLAKEGLGLELGQTIRIKNEKIPGQDDDFYLAQDQLKLVGFVESVDYILTSRGNSSFTGSSSDFFGLVTRDNWQVEKPSYALIKSHKMKDLDQASSLYKEKENSYKSSLEKTLATRPAEVKVQLQKEGQEKIDQALEEIRDGKKDLAQARKDLDQAKKDLDQAWKDYDQEENKALDEINQAKIKIGSEKGQLDQARKDLDSAWINYENNLKKSQDQLAVEENKLTQAKKDLDQARKELDLAQGQLDQEKTSLDQAWKDYYQGLELLEKKKNDLLQSKNQLEGAIEEIENSLDPNLKEEDLRAILAKLEGEKNKFQEDLDHLQFQIEGLKEEIKILEDQLEESEDPGLIGQLEEKLKILTGKKDELVQVESQVQAGLDQIKIQLDQTEKALAGLVKLDELKASLKELKQGLDQIKAKLIEVKKGKDKLLQGQEELDKAEEEIARNESSYQKGLKAYEDGLVVFQKEKTTALDQLDQAKLLLSKNEEDLSQARLLLDQASLDLSQEEEKALDLLDQAKEKILDGQKDYEEGEKEFKKENLKALEEIEEAEKKVEDAKKDLDKIKVPNYIVHGKYDDFTFNTYIDEAESMDSMSLIFTSMFYLVAILVALTTIMRMVDTERVQIGTLKALGYSPRQIAFKYLFYGVSASLIGSILGIVLGYYGLMPPIFKAYTAQTNLEQVAHIFNPNYIWVCLAISVLSIGLAAYYSVNSSLKENAANLMRPKAPEIGRKNFLENFPFIWKRMSFLQKVTFRNLSRNRIRMFMTILGVAGSSGLIAMGYGIKSSVQGIGDKQFNYIYNYDIQALYQGDDKDLEDLYTFLDQEDLDRLEAISDLVTIKNKKGFYENVSLLATDEKENLNKFIKLQDRRSKKTYSLDDQGLIISEKLAQAVDKKVGEKISIKDSQGLEHKLPISHITEHYSGHQIYMTRDFYQSHLSEDQDYNSLLIKVKKGDVKAINKSLKDEKAIVKTIPIYDLNDVLDDLVESLDMVVWVIIVISSLLTFVVLYNLTNINVSERKRELSTIKVLGFRPRETLTYIFRETLILTGLGILIGFIVGRLMHIAIVLALSPSSVLLDPQMNKLSYLYSAILVGVFTLVVMFIIDREIKKIDMVEALKSID